MREARRIAAHEETDIHKRALEYNKQREAAANPTENSEELPLSAFVADGARVLLNSLAAPIGYSSETPSDYTEPHSSQAPALIDRGLSDNTELEPSLEAQGVAHIARQLSRYLDKDPSSDDEAEERSEDEADKDDIQEPIVTGVSEFP